MNAGLSDRTSGKIQRIINDDTNANSIVLLVSSAGNSLLITGDADNATWDHILSNYYLPPHSTHMPTQFMVASHHGSKENGATRPDVLDFFKPTIFFISAGTHKGYGHPTEATIKLLEAYLHEASAFNTEKHYVSYYLVGPEES